MIEGGIFDSRLDVRHFILKSGNQLTGRLSNHSSSLQSGAPLANRD